MTEAQREHNAELDRDYWSDYWSLDVKRVAYTRTDVLEYARKHDATSFFELLEDNAGFGRDLDDLLYCYAEENDKAIQEYVNGE